ncbi:hypothetical protein Lfu02_39720 [Longispora fulva]|uniref:Kef-type K+ transport system membrane component KefB n=1 Tax=Longispora fulva TaxID=619741 RepID=A0A8J7GHL2_9ACTN|nr:cation:proton antiporter [Longispora fulva]MBG6136433.1 Kef-type K+ transport system membrane component KefB [Longispora fulva]GIG59600.1 hypothetical protein Lfu02_39720 [Longispora fulva]
MSRRLPLVYAAFVVAPVAVALYLAWPAGTATLTSRPPAAATPAALPADQVFYRLLLAALVVVAVAHAAGAFLRRLGQPPVVGEIAAGFLLGPSVLGLLAPGVEAALFPAGILPFLDVLAQLGLILFMFVVGRDLPLAELRGSGGTAIVVGHATIATPFLVGVLVARILPEGYRPPGVPALVFALFCGVALSVTAFPVLARILTDRGLADTPVGALGMATAGVGDVTAWCVLALVVTVVRGGSPVTVLRTVALTIAFGALMWWVVRPLLARYATSRVALLFVVLLSALATDRIGVHAIFGAFLAGVVMPRGSAVVAGFAQRVEGLTVWLMLPLFFATVGLRLHLEELGGQGWLVLLFVLAAAVGGKVVGTLAPARAAGLDLRTSVGLATMMNCRGLTEIVVLNVGLSLGVISPRLFAVLVAMALVTTAMTGPLLSRLPRSPATRPELVGTAP